MSHVRRFDHVGITVADLGKVTAFFVGLGLEVEGTRVFVEGEFLDTVIGSPDSRTEIVMLRPPDGGTRLELSSFVRPDHRPGSPAAMANERGCATWPSRSTTSRRLFTGWSRTATGWSGHRPVRARLAHGLRARSGGDHRVPGRADRLTRPRHGTRAHRICRRQPPVPRAHNLPGINEAPLIGAAPRPAAGRMLRFDSGK